MELSTAADEMPKGTILMASLGLRCTYCTHKDNCCKNYFLLFCPSCQG